MAKPYIIRHLMHTWFEEQPSLIPGQPPVPRERLSRLGEEVEFTNENAEKRALELNAVYSDADAEAIRDGTYRGFDRENVYNARRAAGLSTPAEEQAATIPEILSPTGSIPVATGNDATATGGALSISFADATPELLGDFIRDNRVSAPNTLALLPADPTVDDVNKLMDAEVHATNNAPRASVQQPLDKKLTELSQAE